MPSLVQSLLSTWLLGTVAASPHGGTTNSCKAAPGTPEWPGPAAWAGLNASTGGRLLHVPPPGAVCHPGQPTYNATLCPAVQASWHFYPFHDDNPVSVGGNEFTHDCCLPYANYTCTADGYPVYVVNATTPEHVKLGVDFGELPLITLTLTLTLASLLLTAGEARQHNIRLVVKATGHDFIGRSVAPNSLSIWTRYMTGTTLHQDGFHPRGCSAKVDSSAVTALGGTQMLELQTATAAVNETVIGGGSYTISVGGYLTGGGHGLLSSTHGLATDQVLEMEVVTPRGEILTLNACQDQDLFWAMRGVS